MARKSNPALIGGFVLGAVVLAVAGLVVFGGGRFFRPTQPWVAYFDESIKGLAIGAPVTFRGVKVGSVTDIKIVFDPARENPRIPVFFEIDADRMQESQGGAIQFAKDRAPARRLFEQGLRAQLEVQSFVTGQLSINLDFHPDTPMRLVGGPNKYLECPTIPSTMSAIGRGLQDINSAELVKNVQDILQGVSQLVNGPELKTVLVSGATALKGVDRLVANADARVQSLEPLLDKTSGRANDALEAITTLVRHIDNQTLPAVNETVKDAQQVVRRVDGQTVTAVNETVKDAQQLVQKVDGAVNKTIEDAQRLVRRVDTETVPAVNEILADLRPLVAEIRQVAGVARGALERAESALTAVDGALEEPSPLGYEVRNTLREVAAAARAFRTLSNYLERHPDSLLFGKGSQKERP